MVKRVVRVVCERTCEGFSDACIDNISKIGIHSAAVFTDTVKDDNCCVDGIAEDSEQSRNNVGVYRNLEDRVERQHDKDVMAEACYCCEGAGELEADRYINKHEHDSDNNRPDRSFKKSAADRCGKQS